MTDNELIAKARAGDQKAHATLYTKYASTLGGVRKHYGALLPWHCYEDLMSLDNEGYVRAVKNYQSDRGASFRTWIVRQCQYVISLYVRDATCKKRQHLDGMMPADCPNPTKNENIDFVRFEIDKLVGREKAIMLERFKGKTYREIGKDMRISTQRVEQLAKIAIGKLKKRLK